MVPVPWRNVQSWRSVECGMCCRDYHVVLNFNEWATIVRHFGADSTMSSVNKLLLGKNGDGTCRFLVHDGKTSLCGLQSMKPLACKIWPFKVHDKPKFGRANEALYPYGGGSFFIYVDPDCHGLLWGDSTAEFKHQTLPEFIDVAFGLQNRQFHTTSKNRGLTGNQPFRGRTVI